MATFIRPPEALIEALEGLGIGEVRSSVRRVVIDLQVGTVPIIHVEHIGDERLIAVVRALEGVEIRREPAAPQQHYLAEAVETFERLAEKS